MNLECRAFKAFEGYSYEKGMRANSRSGGESRFS